MKRPVTKQRKPSARTSGRTSARAAGRAKPLGEEELRSVAGGGARKPPKVVHADLSVMHTVDKSSSFLS